MNIKLPKGIPYLVVAGLAGLAATFLIHQYITIKTARPVKLTEAVVVASVDINPGTALAPRMLQTAKWPREIVPPRGFRNSKDLEGRVVRSSIVRGEPILVTKLAPEGTAAGLGGLLDPDKLAVTVRTDDVSGVAGFINPGDRVDVLVEMPEPGAKGEHFSKIILQNLKVLSKGQIWDQTAEKKPQVMTTVTLEVNAEEAEIINLASFQGKIRLALRNQLNQAQFLTKGVATSNLFRARVVKNEPASKVQANTNNKEHTIEVIKGMGKTYASLS